MRCIFSSVATIVMLVSQSAVPPAPIQSPRDSRQDRAAGVGAIAGRIADRDTQQPVRWATVTVVQSSRQLQTSTTADADGRYRFDNLPSGMYTLRARKAGYVPLAYGARKPRDPGTPIDVAAGTTGTADVLLSHGGAIEGRILNEYGEPAQDVGMQALRVGYDSTGRRTLPTGQSTRTDDLGWFRLHSLPPGMYLLEASRAFVSPVSPSDQQELAQRPKPFPRTFYPGTARVNEAGYVVVEKGLTRSVDFSLSVEPLSRLSGTVVNSRGEVPEMTGALLGYVGGAPFGGFGLGMNRNQFALTGIQAGAYMLVVTAKSSGSDVEFAMLPVTMSGRDVVEPGIQTAPGVVLNGMVEMDSSDGAAPPANVSVAAISTLFPGLLADPNQRQTPVRTAPNGQFTFRSVFGPRLFRVAVSAPWALQAVMFDGRDVTDVPIDVRHPKDARPLRIVVTNRTGSVSGSVGEVDDAAGSQVVLFSEDERQWVFDSRYTRVAEVRADGGFTVPGVLPGRYVIAHVPDLEPGAAGDPDVLRQLRPTAVPVVVFAGGETQVRFPAARAQ